MDKLTSLGARGLDGRFKKGHSGNYRGRPRTDPRIRALARANSEEAILALVELSIDSKVSEKIQFLATTTLLKVAFNANFFGHYLKRYGMTVGQYLTTPRYLLPKEKTDSSMNNDETPTINNSETVNKILAIREQLNREYAAKQARFEKKRASTQR